MCSKMDACTYANMKRLDDLHDRCLHNTMAEDPLFHALPTAANATIAHLQVEISKNVNTFYLATVANC